MGMIRRRDLLKSSLGATAFAGLALFLAKAAAEEPAPVKPAAGFGPLIPDPKGLLDLPAGFAYRVLSRLGDPLADGSLTPGAMDGMCAFAVDGRTVLIRNHELTPEMTDLHPGRPANGAYYDTACLGGTTTLVLSADGSKVEKAFPSLLGTQRNCSGGPTPWNSWISCEEAMDRAGKGVYTKDHGFAFEVPAAATTATRAEPLTAMGRFRREAICVDPASGVVYQTEDDRQGCLFRFLPTRPGDLAVGGRLQALKASVAGQGTENWEVLDWKVGASQAVTWFDVEDVIGDPSAAARRSGATVFTRGEGIWWHGGSAYFVSTDGGKKRRGQVWKLTPGVRTDMLTLLAQPEDASLLENGDNLTVTPWGDLLLCEDNSARQATKENRLVTLSPGGQYAVFASHSSGSELAGACFSPDGRTLFVNVQFPGATLAITGPWPG